MSSLPRALLEYSLYVPPPPQRAAVEFMYLPLVAAPMAPSLFVLPEYHSLVPLLPTDLQLLQRLHLVTHNCTDMGLIQPGPNGPSTVAKLIVYKCIKPTLHQY